MVCLEFSKSVKRICCGDTHKKCQKKWGDCCIICRKPIPNFKSKNKYKYEYDPFQDMTFEEVRQQQMYLNFLNLY